MDPARRAAETAARASYGRLVALLAVRSRDIAAAEEALAEAFRVALETWPRRGVPERPEAWLLTVARRLAGRSRRHAAVHDAALPSLGLLREEAAAPDAWPDRRLALLFVCAHPAIDAAMRAPLMLQTVLGLDAARIAAAFLVQPAAMGQRLVRAKAKIRDARIRFEEPGLDDLPERLGAVLSAIYAAYGTAWDEAGGAAPPAGEGGLAAEAIALARLLVGLMPAEPEARGLLALMLHCEARAPARRGADGRFVPLEEQDVALWSRALLVEAENHLTVAARAGRFGRFQTEAAIQSLHAERGLSGRANPAALAALYDLLARHHPAVGVLVARAVARGRASDHEAGLAALDAVEPALTRDYQPYWAARGHLLAELGRLDEALDALDRAARLSADPAVRRYLEERAERLRAGR